MSWDDREPEAGFLVRRILLTWLQSFVCGLSYRKTKNNCIWISKDRRQSAYIFPLVLPSRAQHRFLTNACFVLLREQKDDFHFYSASGDKSNLFPRNFPWGKAMVTLSFSSLTDANQSLKRRLEAGTPNWYVASMIMLMAIFKWGDSEAKFEKAFWQ